MLKTYENSLNYTATVVELPVKQTVPGLDNLARVVVFGNDVLVSKDTTENELYLFFPTGTQLSGQFLSKNNLYRNTKLNSDPTAKAGFFEDTGRVKAIKLRGIISTGFLIPISSLPDETHMSRGIGTNLCPGDEFNEIAGYHVCNKYIIKAPQVKTGKGDPAEKVNSKISELMVPSQFRFHNDTSHLGKNLHNIEMNQIVAITDKWHGSSCILAKVLVRKKFNFWQKLLRRLQGKHEPVTEYGYIYSSGKPKSNLPKGIESIYENDGPSYYSSNIWKQALDRHKSSLEDGITLYGELVGYTSGGAFIQKGYDYGCKEKDFKFVVYRITYTKPDGNVIEFTWSQIKNYCATHNLECVKEFFYGACSELVADLVPSVANPHLNKEDHINSLFISLQSSYNMEKPCAHCVVPVPAEGMIFRIDSADRFQAYKLKAKAFIKKEDEGLDKGEVNIEDSQ